jgi:hypothetical protein
MRVLPFVVCAAVSGGVLGCNNPNTVYVSQDRFPAAYAQALCTSLQHCCAENVVSYNYDACTIGWEHTVTSLMAAGGGIYNAQAATQCVQMVNAAASVSCQPVDGSISAARSVCQQVFAGQAALGDPCSSTSQCAPLEGGAVQCAIVPGDGGGQLPLSFQDPTSPTSSLQLEDQPVCVEVALPDSGVPCMPANEAGVGDLCVASQLYCDPTTLLCQPLNGAGGPCDPSVIASCSPGAYCLAGTCTATNPIGSACTDPAECDFSSFCNPATHTCVARNLPGQKCTSDAQCTVGVCDATTKACLTNTIATTATCNGKDVTP